MASAYGIAVTGTLAIDTILFFFVVRVLWHKPLWLVLAGATAFLIVDLAFFSANLTKVLHGGWFPLVIAVAVFVVLMTWQKGREIVTRNRTEEEGPLRAFVEDLHAMEPPVYRAPGTAVFLNATKETTPLAMRANVEHNNTLHENVVIISIETMNVPNVPEADQVDHRRPRLPRRRHQPRDRPASASRTTRRAADLCAWRSRRASKATATRHGLLLPVAHDDRPDQRPGHEPLAQAAVPRASRATRAIRSPTSGCPTTARSSWAPT